MPLAPGTRLGPYEIHAQIGAGGMGEVYRATDINLARDVAIKVLPETFAHDSERLARFEREARILASLNHPNIGAIHGFEKTNGVPALVLELVPGESLADRIAGGPIPVHDALSIATHIADALDAAHQRGVIHRDLKPANVKVTPAGIVKVLDFGLAKHVVPAVAASQLQATEAQTRDGILIGTTPYMSPEQARGRDTDKRTEIIESLRRRFWAASLTNTVSQQQRKGEAPPATYFNSSKW